MNADAAAPAEVAEDYASRGAEYQRAMGEAARLDRRLGMARLAIFAAGVLAVIAIAESQIDPALGAAIVVVAVAGFLGLVAWQASVRERQRLFRSLARSCEAGEARVARRWEAAALSPAVDLPRRAGHAFANDLHVAGTHSIARLLPGVSRMGATVLGEWLLAETPPPLDALRARQAAVRALAPHAPWRERLSVLASRLVAGESSLDAFLAWAEGTADRAIAPAVRWLAVLLAVLTVASVLASVAQLVPAAVPVALIIVNLAVVGAAHRRVARLMDPIAGYETRLRGLGEVLRHAGAAPGDAPELRSVRDRCGGVGGESARAFRAFDQLTRLAEVRLSPMGHFVVQALVLWDVHVASGLERWRARHGASARGWLRALGEVEALAAFATLGHDNPVWCYPEFHDDTMSTFDGEGVAHPLLAPGVPVANDVRVDGPGDILFITGSNMSGKSTLLRAIGLNVVLAQAGAPVCATRLRLSLVRLYTSIEATDALERGLSLFMAELLRIRAIVDAARAPADCRLMYIADEVLRGTNARDRHAAVATILGHLVRAGASGVVATHDPDLAGDERLHTHLRPYHLLEQFRVEGEAPTMWFDYRLRPGLATTRNAIALLELVGLGERSERDPSGHD